ncbi:MAG TPA: cysteine--tRNA ligase [Rhabdochlamydiaceae bacterium]|nr:cysteine--tRNA ligase [Rhabdochlamydiaceae bacterium]
MKLFNTETRTKEELVTAEDLQIRMYTCGPTVYNFAHIGNFRTYVFEDLLRRTLKFFGYKVTQVMNITDIDDKTIRGALTEKVSLKTFTERYTKAFFEDLQTLKIEKVEFYPHATDFVPQMIGIVQGLLDQGIAYKGTDGSIYFAIEKFPSYGRLSHLHLDELKAGASERIATDEYDKEHIADFALWKAYDPERDGQIFWESPFGKGRPGWHIECSAMAMDILGKTIDIHVGGVDNMFPHHENEIAQSEAFSHQRFVRYWLHSEHLLVDHKKMSKSLGNFFTLRDLLAKGYTGVQVRYLLLQTHYRTQLNFSFAGLDAAAKSIERLGDFILRLRQIHQMTSSGLVEPFLKNARTLFAESLADDLNISPALAVLFDLVREVNSLCDADKVGKEEAQKVLHLFEQFDQVLGVLPLQTSTEEVSRELQELLAQREVARACKNWKAADAARDQILASGYIIEDTPSGARLKKK